MHSLAIFTDGGSRGNPGPAALGVCVKTETQTVWECGKYLGNTTNNVAEYQAVVCALDWLLANHREYAAYSPIVFSMDSLLVCSQINGVYKIKSPHLKQYLIAIQDKRQQAEKLYEQKIMFVHVPRAQNKCADAMVNKALDSVLE